MNFQDFIRQGQVRKASIDKPLINSLVETAEKDLLFLNKVRIDGLSARKVISNYYDVLRSILEALACKSGYKIYSHEAFTYFLKELKEPILAEKFDRFRKIRNNINYYGKNISLKEAKEYMPEILEMINRIKKRYFS